MGYCANSHFSDFNEHIITLKTFNIQTDLMIPQKQNSVRLTKFGITHLVLIIKIVKPWLLGVPTGSN